MSQHPPIKDELTDEYLKAKYGSIGGDYWTNISEKEQSFMLGLTHSFTKRI